MVDFIISDRSGDTVVAAKVGFLAANRGRAVAGEGRGDGLACRREGKKLGFNKEGEVGEEYVVDNINRCKILKQVESIDEE